MMYTMPKNLLSICVNFALATQPGMHGKFNPKKTITRAEVAQILCNLIEVAEN